MKSTNTKRALLTSILSVMLCMAMLVGSTFAWFTDSVTSGKNKIQAGNLDVELNWSTDGSTWERVNKDTNMFAGMEWEPGYTRVVYLQVENVGSLALKYKFGINVADKVIGKTADDKDIDLSNFIKFGVVETENAYTADDAGRTAAREAVKDSAVLVSAGYASAERNLPAKTTSDTIALVVYMPEEVGNDANYGTGKTQPSIDLGITLVATQYAEESDSFGSDYDTNAEYDGEVSTEASLVAAIEKGGSYKLISDVTVDAPLTVAQDANLSLNLNGKTITSNVPKSVGHVFVNDGELTLIGGTVKNIAENGGSAIKNNGTLTIDGTAIYGAPQAAGGWPSYGINNAGDMTIKNATIETTHGAIASFGGGTTVVENCEVTMNGFGGSSHVFYIYDANTKVVVNGGTYTHKGNVDGSLAYVFDGGTFTVNDGTFSASNGGYGMVASTNGTIVVNGGMVNNQFLGWGGVITVTGGTFVKDPSAYVPETGDYLIIENADGTKTVTPNVAYGNPSTQDELNDILNNPTNVNGEATKEVVLELPQGNYTLPAITGDKKVTIFGGDNTVIDMTNSGIIGAQNAGLDLTIEGATVNFASVDYKGITHSKKVTYKDCTISGKQFMYAEEVEFINCTFENMTDYCVWTYGAKNVTFTDCEFTTGGKAILVYNEYTTSSFVSNITLNNCIFNSNSAIANNKAAVETGSNGGNTETSNKYNITFNGCTINGFAANASTSAAWGNKNNMDNEHLNIVIDGVDVY